MAELTFLLQKGEKIIKDVGKVYYAGVGLISSGSAIGTQFGNSGVGGGLYSGKQIKREGSIFDAKTAHIFLTNKRIVFCNTKVGFWNGIEKEIGSPFAEIIFSQIKGINSSLKLGTPAIDLSVSNGSNIDNIKFWFVRTTAEKSTENKPRVEERDKFLALIKKQVK